MADKLTPGAASEGANKDHNIAHVNATIRKCRDEMLEIRAERRELNERAGDIRKRIKDMGENPKLFEANLTIYEMEAEDRARHMDSFRIIYEAMNQGDQLDWIGAADGDGQQSNGGAGQTTEAEANAAGVKAGLAGAEAKENPFGKTTKLGKAWESGRDGGDKQKRRNDKGEPANPPAAVH